VLELGSFLNNDCWTVQAGVKQKTENEMCNVHVHNVMFIRDVKASMPTWPRGQIIRPRPHSFWPLPRSRAHGIWPRPHRNWPRGLEYLQRT